MKRKNIVDHQRHREELLRPSRYLGYDHDRIAMYLFSRRAYGIAEKEFRWAVWLNPFEPRFKLHLAQCLCELKRIREAKEMARKVLETDPSNKEAKRILEFESI